MWSTRRKPGRKALVAWSGTRFIFKAASAQCAPIPKAAAFGSSADSRSQEKTACVACSSIRAGKAGSVGVYVMYPCAGRPRPLIGICSRVTSPKAYRASSVSRTEET